MKIAKRILFLAALALIGAPFGIGWILALEHYDVADFFRSMTRVEHVLILIIIFLLCMLADKKKQAKA